MAQGAAYEAYSRNIRWYYNKQNALPTLPATLAAASAIAIPANLFTHTTGDIVVPAVNAGAAATPNIEWREHGATAVQHRTDISPAPTADESSFDIQWQADMQNDLHETLLTEAAGTYAFVIADIQTDAGDGTRGTASGNAEGTLVVMTVQHADAPITLPSGATIVSATSTFTIVNDSAGNAGRSVFHYGQP